MNKNDLKLILILLLLISLSLIIINKTKKEGTTAIVYYENKEILKIDMNLDKEYTVQGLLGDVIIEVKENKIRVSYVSIRLCHSNYGIAYLHTNQIMIL